MINDQFKALFEYDPAMRKLIPEEEASRMSLEEKYHIITTYMRGGGIGGLIGDEYDDDEDLGMGDLSQEERAMVEEEFIKLYSEDPRFKAALEGTSLGSLTLRDKYELIIAYSRKHDRPSSEEDFLGRRPSLEGVQVEG